MSSSLHDSIKAFSNSYLIEQARLNRDQYTDEALKILEEEIPFGASARKKSIRCFLRARERQPAETVHYDKKDFSLLPGAFTTNDSLLVRSCCAA